MIQQVEQPMAQGVFREKARRWKKLTRGWEFFLNSQLLHVTIDAVSRCINKEASAFVQRHKARLLPIPLWTP